METILQALPQEADLLAKLVAWGNARPSIRALILSSSRVRPGGPVDLFSDYDLILAVTDPDRFGQDADWLSDYGRPMVRWGDQSALCGLTTYFRGVVYEDGVKIDYTVWPEALLERIASEAALPEELDEGYRVLLDKDGRTSGWKPPSHRAFIPARPTEAVYRALVEEFWWSMTYVAKSLWREELMFARWCLDNEIRIEVMRRMLEWRMEMDHDWSVRPGVNGRGLPQRLPADIWSEFAGTYGGADIEACWDVLFRLTALFRRVAMEVGSALGYAYPQTLHAQMESYLNAVRKLPRDGAPPPGGRQDDPGL